MPNKKEAILNSKIVVIMPVHNEENFNGDTLENLLQQELLPY